MLQKEERGFHGFPQFQRMYRREALQRGNEINYPTRKLTIPFFALFQKPPEPEKKKADDLEDVIEVRAPISASALPRPPFTAPLTQMQVTLNANFKRTIDELVVPKAGADKQEADESDEVAVGTNCKNGGCTVSYESEQSRYSECVHHPGVPIFHEGMKYWSCCQRKTSDFSAFVAQKGCESGTHKWKVAATSDQTMQCRYDWHQTGNHVVVAIYAKVYDYRVSYVQLNPVRMKVHLVFPQQSNATFDLDVELRGVIDVGKSTVQMMGTKVEITMAKAELGSWAKLNFPPIVKEELALESEVSSLKELKIEAKEAAARKDHDSDSDVDLDDVGPIYSGAKITELDE